ncbi:MULTISPECIES: leucine-rich repeat protein [unclassified Clostridium]|uniref:leucine-rich repeat protein n=1 Tax=unclassified Clostridium TaxID=2614128 RepID=UPI001106C593|nr:MULTISPECIES: leucine-rich repeat protein [unclassified Clostridium]
MRLLYEKTLDGVCLQRCYGLDKILEIPDTAGGLPVTELAGYIFSDTVRRREPPPGEYRGEPELCGSQVEEISLPDTVRKVGAYGFYNCCGLRKLSCSSAVEDWGAGVFTGCTGLEYLDIRIAEGRKSCFKDILSELHQTLIVNYRDSSGTLLAKLIFPEFFEESVENTPARIIMREMHGCGHMYRYCFEGGDFRFDEYDRLFPNVKVQEKPELSVRLALYRLYWPYGLREHAENEYWEYVRLHAGEGAEGLIQRGERDILGFMARSSRLGDAEMKKMVDAAARAGDAQSSALLLDARHGGSPGRGPGRRRTFEL